MLKVHRSPLDPSLQVDLDRRQTAVDNGTAGDNPWTDFKTHERKQARQKQATVKATLRAMFYGKCAYCESNDASEIEHHWPKAPHPQNANRGAPAQMFRWENLLWACQTCNGFECKGPRNFQRGHCWLYWLSLNSQGRCRLLRSMMQYYRVPYHS